MLDKYLKIFGLDNNFSLDELEGKYKALLKEFDTKDIEDDLKIIFLEEQVKIREAYQILLKFNHTREKVSSIKSKEKTLHVKAGAGGEKNKILPIIMTICALLLLALGFSGVFTTPAAPDTKEVVVEVVDTVFISEEEFLALEDPNNNGDFISTEEILALEDPNNNGDFISTEEILAIEDPNNNGDFISTEEILALEDPNNNKSTRTVTRESKSQVKDKCDTHVFTNMQLSKTYKRWERWENKPEDKKLTERYNDEVEELKDLIKKYKKCGCSKCQIALEDGNLKKGKHFIEESQ
jgi:hypothetical protein